ncbi:hypothetical protein [Hymenobacter wooponensis]|uniref:Uncharacterized protein n=1 Tax=Hymenobacter wooponensis TaxID=1525360 RepID=A0A4Z0MG26_9BACT|nr:hypothetical protein [Hymenobacter wooponensis]TGD78466.1 hypothetical protein EU557_20395 [Hymenobacter wooponensis]
MPSLAAFAFASLLHVSALASAQTPSLPTDSTRVVKGFGGQQYAWGKLTRRKGEVLEAYLPMGNRGFDNLVCYYPSIPENAPLPKPKLLPITDVQWMRVRGQYSELLKPVKNDIGRLATRRVAGTVELFVVESAPPIVMALGPVPVLGTPANPSATPAGPGTTSWFLRRPSGGLVVVEPDKFAQQLATYLADDQELARKVAAGQAGYRLEQIESIIQQYNQRAQSR